MSKENIVETTATTGEQVRRSPRNRKTKEKAKVESPESCASSWQNQDTIEVQALFKDHDDDSIPENIPPHDESIGTST